ncbi:hypothetical protein GCM10022237_17330 [Nocardioides ginsengisoli]|uniref:Outer membrane channel protein CpnT-like N-terminal domain-containing protein n=1 Tax=Nocardioides ginsengisoli TaxID=363868 RepID=A0ABW3W0M5_9ACTN
MTVIYFETDHWVAGMTQMYWGSHRVYGLVSDLDTALAQGSGMAGTDTGGAEFARQYDAVAGQLLQAGADLSETMGKLGNLLNTSLINHEGADYGARLAPYGGQSDGDPDPNDTVITILPAPPPSAAGGTGDVPGWWHWLSSHMEGLLWPDADTGRLRTVGAAWLTAGRGVSSAAGYCEAGANELLHQKSAEVSDVVATLHDVEKQADELGTAYQTLGQACIDYADAVDDHHQQVEDAIADFIGWTIAIEAGSAILFEIGGEIWGQAIEAGKIASSASKVVRILRPLVTIAKGLASRILELLKVATSALARFKTILSARVVRAIGKSAEGIAATERQALIKELEAAGTKFDPEAIVTIFRDAEGRIVFLEKGTDRAGLAHIIGRHGPEFAAAGVPEAEVPTLLQRALEAGRIVGHQGKGTGRPIYEVLFGGKTIRVAITVGTNGFIVGANITS